MLKHNVLVAGVAGASLGTEVVKCLQLAGNYNVFACDISPLAYGLSMHGLTKTFLVEENHYIPSVISICKKNDIRYVIPGGEAPMILLSMASQELLTENIQLASNTNEIVKLFADKKKTFEELERLGFSIPATVELNSKEDTAKISYPCIIKPYIGTGGSDSVFLISNQQECILYFELLTRNGRKIIAQDYIPLSEGEFTIGVLSLGDATVVGSIALKRVFNSKLSIHFKSSLGLISSGYSQGHIGEYPELRQQAESIAKSVGSCGPLNIQARVKNGKLMPFEINPRFSASTYLRALAGFNEVDFFLRYLISGDQRFPFHLKPGYYMRSFTEQFIGDTV